MKAGVKVKKSVKIILIVAVIVIVAAVAIVLKYIISENNKTVKFNNTCINIEINGYNTIGKAVVTPNYNEIKKVAMPVFERKYGDSAAEMFQQFFDELEVTTDVSTELSNGDRVSIEISISDKCLKELGVNVSNTEYIEVVHNLEEVVVVNPFDYLDVYVRENITLFEDVPVYCVYQEDNPLGLAIEDFHFEMKKIDDFSSLYKVYLSEVDINRAASKGVIYEQTEYAFEIDDIDNVLVTNFDSISTEALFVAKTTAKRKIEKLYEKATEVSMDECKYYGGWIASSSSYAEGNELSLIFQVKTSHNEGLAEPVTTYIRVSFTDVVKRNDEVSIIGWESIEANIYITDDGVIMGYGNEGYSEYFSDVLLSSKMVKISFDENGSINQY